MNISEAQAVHPPIETATYREVTSGLVGEAIASVAVMALAIVGLANALSATMAAIATIVLGASILIESGFFGVGPARNLGPEEWLSAQFLGGLAGVVLGILALLGIDAAVLLSAAVIVFGAGMLISSLAEPFLGGSVMMGIAAIVLGILGIVGPGQLTLVLVALLCLGAMALLTRAGAAAKMSAARRQRMIAP